MTMSGVVISNTPPRARRGLNRIMVNVKSNDRKPFLMRKLVKRLCEKVGGVLNTRNMMNIDDATIDAVAYEMCAQVDVFHARVGVGVMCTRNSPLIVAIQNRGVVLIESQLSEERAKPNDLASAMSA
jgi:hypothetical protein